MHHCIRKSRLTWKLCQFNRYVKNNTWWTTESPKTCSTNSGKVSNWTAGLPGREPAGSVGICAICSGSGSSVNLWPFHYLKTSFIEHIFGLPSPHRNGHDFEEQCKGNFGCFKRGASVFSSTTWSGSPTLIRAFCTESSDSAKSMSKSPKRWILSRSSSSTLIKSWPMGEENQFSYETKSRMNC